MEQDRYYLKLRGKITGPFDLERLKVLRDRGRLTPFHQVSSDRRNWGPLESVEGLVERADEALEETRAERSVIDQPESEGAVAWGTESGDASDDQTSARPIEVTPVPGAPSPPGVAGDVTRPTAEHDLAAPVVVPASAIADVDELRGRRMAHLALGLAVGSACIVPLAIPALACAVVASSRLRDRALGLVTLIVSIMLATAGVLVTWVALSWLVY